MNFAYAERQETAFGGCYFMLDSRFRGNDRFFLDVLSPLHRQGTRNAANKMDSCLRRNDISVGITGNRLGRMLFYAGFPLSRE